MKPYISLLKYLKLRSQECVLRVSFFFFTSCLCLSLFPSSSFFLFFLCTLKPAFLLTFCFLTSFQNSSSDFCFRFKLFFFKVLLVLSCPRTCTRKKEEKKSSKPCSTTQFKKHHPHQNLSAVLHGIQDKRPCATNSTSQSHLYNALSSF